MQHSNVDGCRLIFLGSMACFPSNGRALTPNMRSPVSHYGLEKAFMSELIEQNPHCTVLFISQFYIWAGQGTCSSLRYFHL